MARDPAPAGCTTAAYGSTHTLKVDVSWANSAADFDLYVLDAAGNTVATSASSADPEEVVLPTTGTYTVRVVPFAPAGESYTAKASLETKPADPAPGTDTRPGFKNFAAPAALKDSNNAGETSIGNNWNTDSTL